MLWLKQTPVPSGRQNVEEEAAVGLINGEANAEKALRRPESRFRGLSKTVVLLVATNVIWALLFTITWKSASSCHEERRLTHEADFVSKPALALRPKTVEFDDLLKYNVSSKSIYREIDPTLPQYFGRPSPEIDAAWKQLLWAEYPAVSPEELKLNKQLKFAEKDQMSATGQFHVALDVFHDLHCLNAVRKELDKEYYGGHHHHGSIGTREGSAILAAAQRDHIDHCLNHVRQALQCRPDLSPAAMHIYPDTDGAMFWVGNAKTHSCYDWDDLMMWAQERRQSFFGFWEEHDD